DVQLNIETAGLVDLENHSSRNRLFKASERGGYRIRSPPKTCENITTLRLCYFRGFDTRPFVDRAHIGPAYNRASRVGADCCQRGCCKLGGCLSHNQKNRHHHDNTGQREGAYLSMSVSHCSPLKKFGS